MGFLKKCGRRSSYIIAKPFEPEVVKSRINNNVELGRYRWELEYLQFAYKNVPFTLVMPIGDGLRIKSAISSHWDKAIKRNYNNMFLRKSINNQMASGSFR